MFLDEELTLMCMCADLTKSDNIQKLNKDICEKCEEYYKNKIHIGMSNKEAKAILDRTFNLFDSFVRTLLKDEDKSLQILGTLFKKHTFKMQFLSMPEMKEFYENLNK